MNPTNSKHKNKWWMRILCVFGIHWYGRKGLGMMGDACLCHVCGSDRYGPMFIVNEEDKA